MKCPGCGISYCINCHKSVEPDLYRCSRCLNEDLARDPFVQQANELGIALAKEKAKANRLRERLHTSNNQMQLLVIEVEQLRHELGRIANSFWNALECKYVASKALQPETKT